MAHIGPFPGMDPWLESRWPGVHHLLISMIQRQLNPQLRSRGLIARIDERVYVEAVEFGGRFARPDVYVVQPPVLANRPATATGATTLVDEPYILRTLDEPPRLGLIEIVDANDGARVITAIEVLSPTKKVDPRGRREYLGKRAEYRAAGVSTVEIDLLRDGQTLFDLTLDHLPVERRTPYAVWVHRAWCEPPQFEHYAIPLRGRLPRFRVPLRPGDADGIIDLQLALDEAYEQGAYDLIDYTRPPEPPLLEDDLEWVEKRMVEWRQTRTQP